MCPVYTVTACVYVHACTHKILMCSGRVIIVASLLSAVRMSALLTVRLTAVSLDHIYCYQTQSHTAKHTTLVDTSTQHVIFTDPRVAHISIHIYFT